MKSVPFLSIIFAISFLLSLPTYGQLAPPSTWPSNQLISDPTLRCTTNIDGIPNKVRCIYDWGAAGEDSLLVDTSSLHPPYWRYVWLMGDGTVLENDTITHVFPAAGVFGIYARATPIYSPTTRPPIKRTTASITGSTSSIAPPLKENQIRIIPDFSTAVLGDTIIVALLYRRGEINTPLGELTLGFPNDDLSFDRAELPVGTSIAPDVNTTDAEELLVWENHPNPKPAQDTMLFVKLRANTNPSIPSDPANPSIQTALVEATLSWETNGNAGGGNDPIFNPGVGKGDDLFVENTSAVGALDRQYLTIRSAADPNMLELSPYIISPGRKSRRLEGVITAQNTGAAGAKILKIEPTLLDDKLIFNSIQAYNLDIRHRPQVFLRPNEGVNLSTDSSKWTIFPDPSSNLAWVLEPYQDFNAGIVGLGATLSKLNFTVNTPENKRLRVGDEIKMKVLIRMDNDSVWTNTAIVKVDLPVKLPLFCGLKIESGFGNTGTGFNQSQRVALTGRWAMRGLPDEYRTRRGIPLNVLPVFWLQTELGYQNSQLTLDVDDAYQLKQAAITPIMLRYIPRMPNIASIAHQRYWGISVSYDAAYTFEGTLNGAAFTPTGLSERLTNSLSASLDLLNILGRRGLSIGVGRRWQRGKLQGQKFNFNHAFGYVHYNFGF